MDKKHQSVQNQFQMLVSCFMDPLDSMVCKIPSSIRCKTDTNIAWQLVIHKDLLVFGAQEYLYTNDGVPND